MPIVTGIAGKVPVDEQTLDVPEAGGRLRDGTPVAVEGSIRYRVTNPLVAVNDSLERERRVLEWLEEREELPGPDGRPTSAQHAAYTAWSEQAVAEHRDEIEAAARAVASPFQGAAPTAITVAVARSAMLAGGTGRVEANGREWTARNQSTVAILAGFRCIVERQEGDTLIVRPM